MESRDELMVELALIDRQLQGSDESTSDLVDALVDTARALRVPVEPSDEGLHLFINGKLSVDSATWGQCGGLVFELEQRTVVDDRSLAARVARRVFELAPKHA